MWITEVWDDEELPENGSYTRKNWHASIENTTMRFLIVLATSESVTCKSKKLLLSGNCLKSIMAC